MPADKAGGRASQAPGRPSLLYWRHVAHARIPLRPPRPGTPLVRTRGNRRTLEFAPGDIQSEMLLSHPTPWCSSTRAR